MVSKVLRFVAFYLGALCLLKESVDAFTPLTATARSAATTARQINTMAYFPSYLMATSPAQNIRIGMEDTVDSAARRLVLISTVDGVATIATTMMMPSASMAVAVTATSTNGVVAVIGAGGRTGMEVTQELVRQGYSVATLTRTGKDPLQRMKIAPDLQQNVHHVSQPINVIDETALESALRTVGATSIIYCASASRLGGTATEVDDVGVGNAAQVAKTLKARMVLISALAVDRPDSTSFQMTNTIGGNYNGIMDAKRNGEAKVRATLKDYVILRPGVLFSTKSRGGAKDIEINQGDTIGGGLSRDELAGLAVGALKSGKKGITVEVYRTSTRAALQPDFPKMTGNEQYGETYDALFASAKSD
jgi:uncharacterized protein YbjT (DUF2867 family)